jgi:hypothetical protein
MLRILAICGFFLAVAAAAETRSFPANCSAALEALEKILPRHGFIPDKNSDGEYLVSRRYRYTGPTFEYPRAAGGVGRFTSHSDWRGSLWTYFKPTSFAFVLSPASGSTCRIVASAFFYAVEDANGFSSSTPISRPWELSSNGTLERMIFGDILKFLSK